MIRFCGLFNVLLLLSSVPAHPMMGDVDTTISPLSAEMTAATSLQEIPTSADEQVALTSKPSGEESDTTMTHAPTTAAAQLDSITNVNTIAPIESSTMLSTITPSIVEMTNLLETTTTTMMDNKIEDPATTTHLAPASEAIESNSVVSSDTTTHLALASEMSTKAPLSEMSTMAPVSEVITMAQALESNSVVPPSEAVTTILPMTLPVTTTTMAMTNSNQEANEMKPPGDTSLSIPNLTSLSSFFADNNLTPETDLGLPNQVDGHVEVDNVLTMSSNEDTTRMATSTDSKTDGGDKQTAPLAPVTEPPKPQDTNELDNGNSGCDSLSTSLAVFLLTVLYLIV